MRAPDGMALEDHFWDNVMIKHVSYKVGGETLSTHEEVTAYRFPKKPLGDDSPYVVQVFAKDAGDSEVACQRTVFVHDNAAPTWLSPPPDHSDEMLGHHGTHAIQFAKGEECSRTADWLFNWYETEKTSWSPTSVDNCQDVDGKPSTYREVYKVDITTGEVGILLHSDNPENQPDIAVDKYFGEQMLLLLYYAVDAGGIRMNPGDYVYVRVHLEDNVGPTADDVTCPAKVHLTLLHNETSATVSWMKPTLNSDNCPPANGQYPPAKEEGRMSSLAFPKLADKYDDTNTLVIGHTGQFEPGTYEVDYSLRDSEGNVYPHECKMHIEVEQYASPVHLECPEEVQASLTGKKNYAPVAWVEPDHTNGRAHQDNNPVNVSYYPAVVPGMPFPWGTTTITVIAEGAGDVAHAAHNRAECSFVVNVTDQRPPLLDGKQYRCRTLPSGATAPGAEPYRLCKAPKHLTIREHSSYVDTGGYSVEAVDEMPAQPCCESMFANGTVLQHHCRSESDMISFCEPGP
jgi:hypothetical protein